MPWSDALGLSAHALVVRSVGQEDGSPQWGVVHENTIRPTPARPPGGVHRHTTTPRQRGGRHATRPVSAHRRDGMFRAPICERDWRPSCIVRRSSSSSVVHAHVRDNRRLVAIKTAFARLTKSDELRGSLQHADEITKLHPISKMWLAKWLAANTARHPSSRRRRPAPAPLGRFGEVVKSRRCAVRRCAPRGGRGVLVLGAVVDLLVLSPSIRPSPR